MPKSLPYVSRPVNFYIVPDFARLPVLSPLASRISRLAFSKFQQEISYFSIKTHKFNVVVLLYIFVKLMGFPE